MSKHAASTVAALAARADALAYLKARGLNKDQPVGEAAAKGDVNAVGADNTVRMIRARRAAAAAAAAPSALSGSSAEGGGAGRWARLRDEASGSHYWWDRTTGATSWSAPPGHADEEATNTASAADTFRRRSAEEAEGGCVPKQRAKFAPLLRGAEAEDGASLANGWVAVLDPATKRVYYWSSRTDEAQWDAPAEEEEGKRRYAEAKQAPPTATSLPVTLQLRAAPPTVRQQQPRRAPLPPQHRALVAAAGGAPIGFRIGGGGGGGGRGRGGKRPPMKRRRAAESTAFDPLDPTGRGGRWADGLEDSSR